MHIQDPAVLGALRNKNCLLPDDSIDRAAIIAAIIAKLEADHVAHSEAEVDTAAVEPGALASEVFGVESTELALMVRGLLSTSASGVVQSRLSDGSMLCQSKRTYRLEVAPGIKRSYTLSTRFLSDDPAVIKSHLLDGRLRKAESAARADSKLAVLTKSRRPDMVEAVDQWAGQLQLTFQTALTAGGQ